MVGNLFLILFIKGSRGVVTRQLKNKKSLYNLYKYTHIHTFTLFFMHLPPFISYIKRQYTSNIRNICCATTVCFLTNRKIALYTSARLTQKKSGLQVIFAEVTLEVKAIREVEIL